MKIKEFRGFGLKDLDKKLMWVEREDLIDEEEDEVRELV